MDEAKRKQLYEYTQKMSMQASKQMQKYLLVVIGFMIYVAHIVLANVFFSPNYRACMERGGMLWSLGNAIVQAIFMVSIIAYIARECVDVKSIQDEALQFYLKTFDEYVVQVVGLCVLFLLLSYGLLFFRCMNPISCKECSPGRATVFNTYVTRQVNRGTNMLKYLQEFYLENMKKGRASIATCRNYYNSSFREAGNQQIQCDVSQGGMPVCQSSTYVTNSKDSRQTGPLLSQFYIMSSGCTCVVGDQYDAYMSPVMIKIALDAGARCLDFNISNYSYSAKSFPIVTISRDYDKKNLQHNFVLLEDAMKTLTREWLQNKATATRRDPLFIRLNLDAGVSKKCMDDIAYLLQYYLNEQHGNHLLPVSWNYKSVDTGGGLGIYPLCAFFDHIVIMVNSPYRKLSALLDGMVNVYVGKGYVNPTFEIREWKDVKAENRNERMEFNKLNLTYVETSFHPYSLVGHKQPYDSIETRKVIIDDSMSSLLLNKQSINNSPMPPFIAGCQFIAMNLQNLDDDLKLYLSVFDKASFILKPKSMWPTDMLTDPPPPPSLCKSDTHTAYTKKTADGTSCYELCVPNVGQTVKNKDGVDTQITTTKQGAIINDLITKLNYTELKKREDACMIPSVYQVSAVDQSTETVLNIPLTRRKYNKT